MADRGSFERIDFRALNEALLARAHLLVPDWLPGGVKRGKEWVCGDLTGGAGGSCSVNMESGVWKDFQSGDAGGDLVSLYAAIFCNGRQGDAGRELAERFGLAGVARPSDPAPKPEAPPEKRRSMWRPIVPVPDTAPAATFTHFHHGEASAVWEYRTPDGAQRLGYVCRFDRPDGGKEIMPLTWCVDESDARGTCKWHWKQFDEPRPLYVAGGALRGLPVVPVEGEKCADAAHALLGAEFDFVSWPGGCQAAHKADWSWLAGADVTGWADADLKREALSKAEKEQGVDPSTKPFKPLAKQPGYAAMAGILATLRADHGCTVRMVPLPSPDQQAEPDGWDVADAIAAGATADDVRARIVAARPFVVDDGALAAGVGRGNPRASTPAEAGAGERAGERAWRGHLLLTAQGAIKPVRENLVLALDGLPGRGIAPAPGCGGVIGFNAFTNDVMLLRDAPWGSPAGVWSEVDELKMGEYLVRDHWLPSCSRGTLEEAVRIVAHNHRFHPVRAYLDGLRWDGQRRLETWLQRACLVEDEWDMRDPLQRYLARVGTWFLQAMCARIVHPGCKFDYMLILEGEQGMRKSSLFAALGGAYFADTGLVLGDKDSYQNLQGKWIYEFAELDSLGKADVTKVKSFVASSVDRFRASFDRRACDYPRQCVFGGTTNEDHYLTDPTGNRRFWPVRISRQIDIEWVLSVRDQLFAEAMERVRAGKRMHPTLEEERELFAPQQQHRQVENAIESAASRWLYDNAEGQIVDEISIVELLGKLGIGIDRLGPGRYHEKQAGAALRRMGWTEARSSRPGRPRVYRRPRDGVAQPDVNGAGQCPV